MNISDEPSNEPHQVVMHFETRGQGLIPTYLEVLLCRAIAARIGGIRGNAVRQVFKFIVGKPKMERIDQGNGEYFEVPRSQTVTVVLPPLLPGFSDLYREPVIVALSELGFSLAPITPN